MDTSLVHSAEYERTTQTSMYMISSIQSSRLGKTSQQWKEGKNSGFQLCSRCSVGNLTMRSLTKGGYVPVLDGPNLDEPDQGEQL